jgi:uncharacterized damage-inducible protein DinB
MATTVSTTPMSVPAFTSQKQQWLDAFEREHATTVRVLRAYPKDKMDLRPAPKCKTARELAFVFAAEQEFLRQAVTGQLDFSKPPEHVPPPETMEEIIDAYEDEHARTIALVRDMPDEQLQETFKFFVAPKTMGDVKKMDFLWLLHSDAIHHRGQFSIYLRLADGRCPSIYGPTADEPWM